MSDDSVRLSCASKTFLLGEYLALKGGPTLVMATEPRFVLHCRDAAQFSCDKIHPDSPAGRYLQDNAGVLGDVAIHFEDPHQGLGGFGASSAQFLLAYGLLNPKIEPASLLSCYQDYAKSNSGMLPSGADVVAQWQGGLSHFDRSTMTLDTYSWPFADLEILLIHTQQKLATHEHLKTLPDFEVKPFIQAMDLAMAALSQIQADRFIEAVLAYRHHLGKLGFIAKHSLHLLEQVDKISGVVAAKGCGAMGADVILVVVDAQQTSSVKKWCEQQALSIIAHQQDISPGLFLSRAFSA